MYDPDNASPVLRLGAVRKYPGGETELSGDRLQDSIRASRSFALTHDRMIAGMSKAGADLVFETEMQTLAQAIEAMWSDHESNAGTKMADGFGDAWKDRYAHHGPVAKVYRADGTVLSFETPNGPRIARYLDETSDQR